MTKSWFEIIDYPTGMISREDSFLVVFITPSVIFLTMALIAFSIINHQNIIKKCYSKPKDMLEYTVEINNRKSGLFFFTFSFFLSMYLIFFLLLIPFEQSIETIPFVGENLKIFLNDVIVEFSSYIYEIFNGNSSGLDLPVDSDFAEKLFVFSVLASFGPILFLVLRLFRIRYNNTKQIDNDTDGEFSRKKPFPGTGSLVIFLYIVLALAVQKYWSDPNGFSDIGTNWILATTLFTVPIIGASMLINDKVIDKLNKKLFS